MHHFRRRDPYTYALTPKEYKPKSHSYQKGDKVLYRKERRYNQTLITYGLFDAVIITECRHGDKVKISYLVDNVRYFTRVSVDTLELVEKGKG